MKCLVKARNVTIARRLLNDIPTAQGCDATAVDMRGEAGIIKKSETVSKA